jgi:hypothetical protein
MDIINTIGWKTPWLRRVIGFCCKDLDYPAQRIVKATFRQAHLAVGGGVAYCRRREIAIKINPVNSYPIYIKKVRDLPEISLRDAVEVLIHITAHEIAHLERWDRIIWNLPIGIRDTLCERDTEALARMVLKSFRDRRTDLLAAWGESGPGPTPPSVRHRLTCRSCGRKWEHARRPKCHTKRFCRDCNPGWKRGMPDPEALLYERVQAV